MSDYTNYKQGGSEPVSGDIVQMAVGEYTQNTHLSTNSTSKTSGAIGGAS